MSRLPPPPFVPLLLPRWHRTISGRRYFLNVWSPTLAGPRQPGSEGGAPVIGHAELRHKRPSGCSCQSSRRRRRRRRVGKADPGPDSGLNIYDGLSSSSAANSRDLPTVPDDSERITRS
ncbi:uncharacterized protein V6R79_012795 [Siganus canaliculatus]